MSRRRLCVRISNCSRLFLSICGDRKTVKRLIEDGRGIGPQTSAPYAWPCSQSQRGLVKNTVIKCLQPDPNILVFHFHIPFGAILKTTGGEQFPASFRFHYLVMPDTTPAPTVRPPSRIAKRRPSSIAIGAISSTSMAMLSPGMTISVPAGSTTEPVTSVVRK